MSSDSSNADGRVRTCVPMAPNCCSPSPSPACRMKRPGASVASVPTCSATSTGFHSGRRKSAPNGASPHSARHRARIGTFW